MTVPARWRYNSSGDQVTELRVPILVTVDDLAEMLQCRCDARQQDPAELTPVMVREAVYDEVRAYGLSNVGQGVQPTEAIRDAIVASYGEPPEG